MTDVYNDTYGFNNTTLNNTSTEKEADGTLYSVFYQISFAFLVVGGFMIGYELLRQSRFGKYIYAPRLLLLPDQTPEVANGWFCWFRKNKKINEDYILQNNGLDAAMVLKLYRMGYQMFLYIGLFVLIFTLPVNIFCRDRNRSISESTTDLIFGKGVDNDTQSIDNDNVNINQTLNNNDTFGIDNNEINGTLNDSLTKNIYNNYVNKRELQVDIKDFDISNEDERNAFFDEEIRILDNIRNARFQKSSKDSSEKKNDDQNGKGKRKEKENEKENEKEDGKEKENGDDDNVEDGTSIDNPPNNNSTDQSASLNNNTTDPNPNKESLTNDIQKIKNETVEKLKEYNVDIKKYVFFGPMEDKYENFALIHILAVYVILGVICYKLFRLYQDYIASMEKYVKDGGIVQERNLIGEIIQHSTIMVRNIPPELQDDEKLLKWFTKLGIGKIENVVIARSRNKIRRVVEERTKVLNNLESDYVNWLNNIKNKKSGENFLGKLLKKVIEDESDDIGEKAFEENDNYRPKHIIFKYMVVPVKYVDSIHYNEQKLLELTTQIKELRLEAADSKKWSQTAFITFSSHQSAKIAAQLILYSSQNPNIMSASTAPHPNDINYKNLNIRTETKTYRSLMIYVAMYFSCFVLFVIVSATKYDTLKTFLPKLFPNFKDQIDSVFNTIDSSQKLNALFTDFLQVILLNTFLFCVPYILKFLSNLQGFETKSAYANSILKKYYVFLFVTIVLAMAISALVNEIFNGDNIDPNKIVSATTYGLAGRFMEINANQFIQSITNELAKNSLVYLNYGILRLQSFGFEIFRIGAVVSFFLGKLMKKDTPRAQHISKLTATPPDYSIMLAVPLLCFTLFITFSVINPFIPFIGVIYFYLGYQVMKNQFIYVYIKDYESQGHYFITAFNRIIFSLFLFEIFMFGLFLVVFENHKIYPYLVLPSLILTYYFYDYCRKCFKPRIDNVPVDLLISKERNEKYTNLFQRKNIFGKTESFISDYFFTDDSYISCVSHTTSLDSKSNQEILKMSEDQAPDLPPYYEAKSYNNPALTDTLYSPWIPDEAQKVFTEATLNNIVDICKKCIKCDSESRYS